MTWGVESNVVERFGKAAVLEKNVSFVRDTFRFDFSGAPSAFVEEFRNYYGPTMNAFEAAEKAGRATELKKELDALFESQNTSSTKDSTSIPATYLRVTVKVD